MKKTIKLFTLLLMMTGSLVGKAQIKFMDITNWLGEGKDSATLVVNFVNGEEDSCLAWGCLFDDSISGNDILDLVALHDPNFDVNKTQFLNSITYKETDYTNNDNGNSVYWNTFNWDNGTWNANSGLGEMNFNGDQYGLSYTGSDKNWNPIHLPVQAKAVQNPLSFTFEDVAWWIGSGTDSSVLVLDFQDGQGAKAWGYIHDGTKTGSDMLAAIDAAETYLNVYADKFLDSIKFHNQLGINGAGGNYWGTWSATNMTNWKSNSGITTVLNNGDYFGVSYTDFNPAILPAVPTAVTNSTSLKDWNNNNLSVFPNPTKDKLHLNLDLNNANFVIQIMDIQGKVIYTANNETTLSVSDWNKGIYTILVSAESTIYSAKFVKN